MGVNPNPFNALLPYSPNSLEIHPPPSRLPHTRPRLPRQGTRVHEPVGTGRGDGAEPEGDGVALWSETPGSGPSGRPEMRAAYR